MSSTATCQFPFFAQLPDELQSKIWRAAYPRPAIHIFDVCFPSPRSSGRSKRAFTGIDGVLTDEAQWKLYKDTVFLDTLEVYSSSFADEDVRAPGFLRDPSMYRFAATLRGTCVTSHHESGLAGLDAAGLDPNDDADSPVNAVYLPGKGRWVRYHNDDVLCLRFGREGSIARLANGVLLSDEGSGRDGGIGDALDGVWSEELAATLRRARKVALDVSELWATDSAREIIFEEMAYLSCVLQMNLEVLYLVDYCAGRCRPLGDAAAGRQPRSESGGSVAGDVERRGDVVYGMGKTYTEVRDLDRLGWDEDHPTRVMARALDETIRGQQGMHETFLGVRVLVCEDTAAYNGGGSLKMYCSCSIGADDD